MTKALHHNRFGRIFFSRLYDSKRLVWIPWLSEHKKECSGKGTFFGADWAMNMNESMNAACIGQQQQIYCLRVTSTNLQRMRFCEQSNHLKRSIYRKLWPSLVIMFLFGFRWSLVRPYNSYWHHYFERSAFFSCANDDVGGIPLTKIAAKQQSNIIRTNIYSIYQAKHKLLFYNFSFLHNFVV